MMYISFILFLLFLSYNLAQENVATKQLKDNNEHCSYWASVGECNANPNYMLAHCALSCQNVKLNKPSGSLYSILEDDIHGNVISFDRFRGKVVYIVNVASRCGYTQENYNQFKALKKYIPLGLDIVLAPCNAFGNQEPGTPYDIYTFADRQEYDGIILSKGEVNGPKTRPLFKFLKDSTGRDNISW